MPAGLAFRGEREHRLDQRLELECRVDLAEEACLLGACVPELMRCSGRDDELVAFVCTNGLAADAEVERSVDDVEALGLGGMDVGGCDDAVRLDDRLDADDLATGLGCGLVEDQHFACYRVLEPFSWTDHGSPFGAGCDARQRAWHRARRRRPAAGSFVRPRWDLLLIPRRDSERERREDSTSVDDRVDRRPEGLVV